MDAHNANINTQAKFINFRERVLAIRYLNSPINYGKLDKKMIDEDPIGMIVYDILKLPTHNDDNQHSGSNYLKNEVRSHHERIQKLSLEIFSNCERQRIGSFALVRKIGLCCYVFCISNWETYPITI